MFKRPVVWLLLLLLFGAAGTGYFAYLNIRQATAQTQIVLNSTVVEYAQWINSINNLLYRFQEERFATLRVLFASNQSEAEGSRKNAQAQTDQARNDYAFKLEAFAFNKAYTKDKNRRSAEGEIAQFFYKELPEGIQSAIIQIEKDIISSKLKAKRESYSDPKLSSPKQVYTYYSDIQTALINAVASSLQISPDSDVSQEVSSLLALLHLIDDQSDLRDMVLISMNNEVPLPEIRRQAAELQGRIRLHRNNYGTIADQLVARDLELKLQNSEANQNLENLVNELDNWQWDQEAWKEQNQKVIALYHQFFDQQAGIHLQAIAESKLAATKSLIQQAVIISSILGGLGLLVVILGSIFSTSRLVPPATVEPVLSGGSAVDVEQISEFLNQVLEILQDLVPREETVVATERRSWPVEDLINYLVATFATILSQTAEEGERLEEQFNNFSRTPRETPSVATPDISRISVGLERLKAELRSVADSLSPPEDEADLLNRIEKSRSAAAAVRQLLTPIKDAFQEMVDSAKQALVSAPVPAMPVTAPVSTAMTVETSEWAEEIKDLASRTGVLAYHLFFQASAARPDQQAVKQLAQEVDRLSQQCRDCIHRATASIAAPAPAPAVVSAPQAVLPTVQFDGLTSKMNLNFENTNKLVIYLNQNLPRMQTVLADLLKNSKRANDVLNKRVQDIEGVGSSIISLSAVTPGTSALPPLPDISRLSRQLHRMSEVANGLSLLTPIQSPFSDNDPVPTNPDEEPALLFEENN